MKRSLKTILTLFFVLCTFVLTESLHAWWSKPNNMHFRLLNLSQSKLVEVGLFNFAILQTASNCPDGPNKSLVHKDPERIRLNFCATVGMALKGNPIGPIDCRHDCQSITDCMGRTFHYLEDLADSTHADNHIEDSRRHAYDRFDKIKGNPRLGQYIQKYNGIFSNKSYMSLINDIHRETSYLKDDLRKANNKDTNTRTTERDEVFAKNFALIKASQDRLIDLYIAEFKAYASNTCKDTPAYCKGLEKKIRQVCLAKDVNNVKRLLDEATAINCKIPKNAYQGCAATTPATPVAPLKPSPLPQPQRQQTFDGEKKDLEKKISARWNLWSKKFCNPALRIQYCNFHPNRTVNDLLYDLRKMSPTRENLNNMTSLFVCYDQCMNPAQIQVVDKCKEGCRKQLKPTAGGGTGFGR
jgi:hypothetical protein